MEIDFNLSDDLNVNLDPETYQDQTNPAPPPAGNYRMSIEKWSIRKDQNGDVVYDTNDAGKPTFPRIVLEKVKLVEPFPYVDRMVGLYQDLKTKPKQRYGETVNELSDIIRALDQTQGFSGLKAGLTLFGQLAQTNTLSVSMDWFWNDREYVQSMLDEHFNGRGYFDLDPDERKAAGEFYNKAKLTGMKRNRLPNGKFSHIWTGPSGNKIEARLKITRFFPSLSSVRYYIVEG